MEIKKIVCDLYGQPIEMAGRKSEETRVSFYFDDGDNWHFQLKKDASKVELRDALLGVAKLINKTINES